VRISELLAARRDDVNLTAQRLNIRVSKAQAGIRSVDLSFGVRDELVRYLADHPGDDDDLLLGTHVTASNGKARLGGPFLHGR
jgi:integrase